MLSPHLIGLAGKLEASYLAGGAIAPATDGIMLAEPAEANIGYGFDGSRAAPPGTIGNQRRVAPLGATLETTLKIEPKGCGVAYSASNVPPGHILRRLAGFEAAVTTTGGAEKWVYTPTPNPANAASGVLDLYAFGEKYPLTGVLADWSVGADGPVVPIEEFAIRGLLGAVDDAAVAPTLAYPFEALLPPVSAGAGLFSLGLFTGAILRKWRLRMQREITPLLDQNRAGGHSGFRAGRRNFELEVTFETPAKVTTPFHAVATIDAKRLYESAAELSWAVNVGSVQYNRRKITGPKAQISKAPVVTQEENTVVTTIALQLNPTAAGANDEVTDTWD